MWTFLKRLFGDGVELAHVASEPDGLSFVRCIEAPDATRKVFIRLSGDRFMWDVESLVQCNEGGGVTYEYWARSDCSGLYASADDAEADARKSVPWLREMSEGQSNE